MDGDLSTDALHKLDAAFTSSQSYAEERLPVDYVKACRAWYASLSESDRANAAGVVSAVIIGTEARALALAAALPSAPPSP